MTLRGPQNKQQQKTKKQKTERVSVTQKSFWNNFPPPPPMNSTSCCIFVPMLNLLHTVNIFLVKTI